MKIAVLNAGTGNVRSVVRALERVGAKVLLTADQQEMLEADGLVVPGVGAFASVMQKISATHADTVIERRLAGGRAVLGICVGLQIMFEKSTEHGEHAGLAQFPGSVDYLAAPVVPHMGWSAVRVAPQSRLLNGLNGESFYFVHSYAVQSDPSVVLADSRFAPPTVSFAEHGKKFVAAIEQEALSATQFHPEKSADAGMQVLENWLQTI